MDLLEVATQIHSIILEYNMDLLISIIRMVVGLLVAVVITSPIVIAILLMFTNIQFLLVAKIYLSIICFAISLYYLSKILDILDD